MTNGSPKSAQEEVEAAAEDMLGRGDYTIQTLTAYKVAQYLGRNANATIYKWFEVWKSRKLAEAGAPQRRLSAEMLKPLEDGFEHHKAAFMAECVRLLGGMAKTLEDDANLKVVHARRGEEEAEERAAELLANWEREEVRVAEAQERIKALEAQVAEGGERISELRGRMEQLTEDRDRLALLAQDYAVPESDSLGPLPL